VVDGQGAIVIDGVDCPLESRMIYHVAHLSTARIILARAGGIQSDQEIRIVFPRAEAQAIERGVFRGILDTVGPQVRGSVPKLRDGTRDSGEPRTPNGESRISEAVIRSVTREGWSDFSTEVAGRIEKALNSEFKIINSELGARHESLTGAMRDAAKSLNSEFIIQNSKLSSLLESIERRVQTAWWRRIFQWKY
jgi:hypothetical protein